MNQQEVAELTKCTIMNDLFVDINNNQCLIDCYLKNSNSWNIISKNLHEESLVFLKKNKNELSTECNKGQILFFRKYAYEKILNKYIMRIYNIDSIEMNMFALEKETEEQKKRQLEKEKQKKQKKQRKKEEFILNHIKEIKWEKLIKADGFVYKAVNSDGGIIELRCIIKYKKEKAQKKYILTYDKKQFSINYDGESIERVIKETNPKKQRLENIIINTEQENKKNNKKEKGLSEGTRGLSVPVLSY